MNLLDVNGLNISFSIGFNDSLDVIKDLNMTMNRTDTISMIGESGSGKSVIASAILRILESNATVSGNVSFEGEDIYGMTEKRILEIRSKDICLIPQNASQAWDPLTKIGRQMTEFQIKAGILQDDAKELSRDMLSKCGFDDPDTIMGTYPHRLSGGMCQRAMIAMCMSVSPALMIADEPTKGLDVYSRGHVLDLMTEVGKNSALLMISHDLQAAMHCRMTSVLYGGVIVERGPSCDVLNDPLHPYTKGLHAAHPRNGMRPIPGTGLRAFYNRGCIFSDRCSECTDECKDTMDMMIKGDREVRCLRV